MNAQENPAVQIHSLDFLIAEYEALRELRAGLVSFGESRVNFFLAAVSGALLGLALIGQLSGYGETVYVLSGIILVGLILVGLVTFARTVESVIAIKIYTRGMNRIRHYFAEQSPTIKSYLILPMSDDVPSFTSAGFLSGAATLIGLPATVALVNSIVAAASIWVLVRVGLAVPTALGILTAILTLVLMYLAQYMYHVVRLRKIEDQTNVHFPSK